MTATRSLRDFGGPPVEIMVYLTPDGWRQSSRSMLGVLSCGRPQVEPDASDEKVKSAAAESISTLCTEFFLIAVDITWVEDRPHAWTGTVLRADGQPWQ